MDVCKVGLLNGCWYVVFPSWITCDVPVAFRMGLEAVGEFGTPDTW